MSHWKPELQAIDVSAWPTVAYAELGEAARRAFERRREAVVRYAAGESVKSIELSTGVNRRQLYRLLERAMLTHRDGRPFGFRVLVPYTRIAEYRRVQAVVISRDRGSLGAAGALSLLFEQYPALAAWLRLKVRQRKVLLVQIHTDSGLRTRLQGLRVLHDEFLCQCRTIGLSAADYPFNTSDHAIRSLSRRVKAELLRRFDTAARSAGASHLKGLPRPNDTGVPAASRPYQVVEFDGHRLDIRLKVVTRDPLGFEHEFEIERAWLLVIIDVCTRAVLGYHIALGREYSRYDVVKTIENALEPHRERGFTIAGLAYGPQDGFPSQRLPELAYATWEWMKLDNGRANLANETLTALCDVIGCLVDAGPKYSPDERPYIERFFGTMASRLSSRLPGYTGSHPRDLRRALSDPKGNLRLYVSFDELEELVEYAIASYNGTPHGGLNNVTPLEAIGYFVRGRQTLVTWLAEHHRRALCLMQSARRCRVRAYLDQGVRPHINLHGARYTNRVLATSTYLIGQQLLVYMNTDDLRCVRAFLSDGAELGVLDVQGSWRLIPHNLKLRQEILKQAGERHRRGAGAPDLIGAYVEEKLAGAKTARKSATELANVSRLIAAAPAAKTPPGPALQPETEATLAPDAMATPAAPTDSRADHATVAGGRLRKLSIGTGQVF